MPFTALLALASMFYILKIVCKISGNRKKNRTLREVWHPSILDEILVPNITESGL
jgi:hypothetical protein